MTCLRENCLHQDKPKEDLPIVLPPLAVNSEDPDKYTKTGPLFIPNGAPHQVFRFCRWGIEYGTDDKGHAASIILSVALLCLLLILFLLGTMVERTWIADALQLVGTAFTFTAGVAIGKGSSATLKEDE